MMDRGGHGIDLRGSSLLETPAFTPVNLEKLQKEEVS
jgi:hypothetical protein